jgi:hypothetical protein
MGNSASDVNDAVKAQASGSGAGPAMYGILGFAGGVLADHWKEALLSKNYDSLDEYIKNELPNWMYNAGNGDKVYQNQIQICHFS